MGGQAVLIRFKGVVQGVGFRPFVYRVAREMEIKGWVNNTTSGVTIHAEGENLAEFYHRLLAELPPLAKVTHHSCQTTEPQGYQEFKIVESTGESSREVLISPDVATCRACVEEINHPENRRFQYPFTNCTNCGPRYTIIFDIPYDRPNTTMGKFPMCPECEAEYHNPADRRFHAQPIACPRCGPRAVLYDAQGYPVDGLGIKQLAQGAIVAVKGLGGFHLACNALNEEAVRRLRLRKVREAKPFAVMAKNIEVVRNYCHVSKLEEDLLTSPAAPIVILRLKTDAVKLPPALAPKLDTLGVMLPYTPLHHLLMGGDLDLLVMTSANLSGEPLIYDNREALCKLKGIADFWLLHDRDIYQPCDDSVVKVINDRPVFFRRARGYVPLPLDLDTECLPVLGVGGDLKNTFCLLKDKRAFLSQHGGDLSNYDNYCQFQRAITSMQRVVNQKPQLVAYDLHPEYYSTRFAKSMDLPGVAVQHHHAHLAACLAEYGIKEKVLGVVCDGTGYGLDGKIWGFEFLWGNRKEFVRVGHLEYLPLPGGDLASKFPSRIAWSYLVSLLKSEAKSFSSLLPGLSAEEMGIIQHQVSRSLNTYYTSSCGRLFDAVSALLGVCTSVNYEGQAAVELEAAVDDKEVGTYDFVLDDSQEVLQLRVKPLFTGILEDLTRGVAKGKIAAKFHCTVGKMILDTLHILADKYTTDQVALSGGVFQNKYLTEYLISRLENAGFRVYQHSNPGDGSLCLGQAVIASEVMRDVPGHSR